MSAPVDITPAQAARLVRDGEVVLLDVREPDEWAEVHVPEATHVPLGVLEPSVFEGRVVLALCRSGRRSARAVDLLTAAGVDARNVAGGMVAWQQEGLGVVGGASDSA